MDDQKRSAFLRSLYSKFEGDNGLSKCCAVRALERLKVSDDVSLEYLLMALDDNDPDVRSDSAACLGRLRISGAAEVLLDHLSRDPEGEVRIEVARALGNIGSGPGVAALVECVKAEGYPDLDQLVDDYDFSPSWDVQAQALESLGQIGDPSVAEPLAEFLSDPDNDHLLEAGFRILGAFDSVAAHRFLLERLLDDADRVRGRSARALGLTLKNNLANGSAEAIIEALTRALDDHAPAVRLAAAHALSDLDGAVAVAPLTRLLTDDNEEVRVNIIKILGKFEGEAVRRNLEILLRDPRRSVKRAAIEGLGKIGDAASGEALCALLDGPDDRLVFDVIEAIGRLDPSDEAQDCSEPLVAVFADTRRGRDIRMEAAEALGEMLQSGAVKNRESVGSALCEAIEGPDPSVASAALSGLMHGEPGLATDVIRSFFVIADIDSATESQESAIVSTHAESGVEDVEETFEIPDPSRSTLGAILLRAHSDAEADAEAARRHTRSVAAEDPRRRLKLLGLRLLAGQKNETELALDILSGFAFSEDVEFRREAIVSLSKLGVEETRSVLVEALSDADSHIRVAALEGLSRLARADGLTEVVGNMIGDDESEVRQSVVRIAGTMEAASQRLILVPALQDDNELVCRAAITALDHGDLLPETRQALLKAGLRFSGNLRFEVGRALKRADDEAGISGMLQVLEDPDREEYHWICMDALAETFSIMEERSGAGV